MPRYIYHRTFNPFNAKALTDNDTALVEYGLAHRDLSGITAIGIDEMQYSKGHNYMTLVYQINEGVKRLLYVGQERTSLTLLRFFHKFGKERCLRLKYVCSDMWPQYLKVIKKKAKNALNILDRFHIVKKLNDALNVVRAQEARAMNSGGYEPVLKHTRYCFLKNEENLTDKQKLRLKDVLQYDLKTVRAYLLKEAFQCFWNYKSAYWAEWFLDKWCTRAMRSRLAPIKRFVKTLRGHKGLGCHVIQCSSRLPLFPHNLLHENDFGICHLFDGHGGRVPFVLFISRVPASFAYVIKHGVPIVG